MARKTIGEDPLKENEEIIREFFKPSKGKAKSERPKSATPKEPKMEHPELVKATFYLAQKHILALEELRLKLMKQQRQKVDKSELVRRAIELLVHEYTKGG